MTPQQPELRIGPLEAEALRKLLEQRTGIAYQAEKHALLATRLLGRLRARGVSDFASYLSVLRRPEEQPEVEKVIDALTTHETSFWREPAHFDFITRHVTAMRPRPAVLRAWSAAASSGEEAFTLAMVLAALMPLTSFEVLGTDVASGIIEKAKTGLFPLARSTTIPELMLKRFCLRGQGRWEGQFLVAKELRNRVTFEVANLMVPQSDAGPFDLVLVRNVLIYFDAVRQERVIRNLVDRLKPGGLLIVGHSETAPRLPNLRQLQPSIYRREDP